LPQMLAALDATITEPVQIVVAGQKGEPETEELLRTVRRRYLPNKVVLLADGGAGQKWLAEHIDALDQMKPVHGRAAAYVCRNFACKLPVTEPGELAMLLESL